MGCCNARVRIARAGGESFRVDINSIPNVESILPKDTKVCLKCGQLANLSSTINLGPKRMKTYACSNCNTTEQIRL